MEGAPKAIVCRYIALDIHKHYSVVGGVNRDGEEILEACRVEHGDLEKWCAKHLLSCDRVVIESTTNAWHVYDLLEPLVEKVLVANPIKVKQIAQARVLACSITNGVLEQACNGLFDLGRGHVNGLVMSVDGVSDPRKHIGQRIGHTHGFRVASMSEGTRRIRSPSIYQLDFVTPGSSARTIISVSLSIRSTFGIVSANSSTCQPEAFHS